MKKIVAVLILFSAILAGCSKKSYAPLIRESALSSGEASMDYQRSTESAASEDAASEIAAGALNSEKVRKLVRRASLRIRVENPEKAEEPLLAAMAKYGAYASSAEAYDSSRSYTIRVPAASYTALFTELSGMGKLLSRTESAEDVTLQFYDLEGRLATKQELLRTFQRYLSQAKNIDEIMTVERRIAELQQEIDWTGTELRSLADLVDYATIDVELQGPQASYAAPSAGERIINLFHSFGDFASTVLVALTGIIIYGIPIILILALLFWLLFGRIGLLKKLWRFAAGNKGEPK